MRAKYVFDAYVMVTIDVPDGDDPDTPEFVEQARALAEDVEKDVDAMGVGSIVLFDAYGIENNDTDEQIREVG